MDHLDARQVLSRLASLADQALANATADLWRCPRAVPRIDGSLYFELQHDSDKARLDWIAASASESLRLVWSAAPPRMPVGTVQGCMQELLHELTGDPAFLLIHYANREQAELAFDDRVVDMLLADRFGPGRTRWFGYRFQSAFQDSSQRFQLTFTSPGGELVFEVCEPGSQASDSQAVRLLTGKLFSLHLLTDPRTAAQRQLLPHQVERFLGFALHRAVHEGMRLVHRPAPLARTGVRRSGKVTDPPPDHDTNEHQPDAADGRNSFDGAPVSTTRWGNPEQWYQFFSDFEVERSSLCSVRFTDPVSYVVHGEMECRGIEPNTFGKRVDFVNSPWPVEPPEMVPGSEGHFTGLVEQDAILGGTAKLQRVLEQAIRNPNVRMICLNNTCLPKIIGDDVSSLVARMRVNSPVPILNMNTDLDSPEAAYLDLVRQAREALGDDPPPAERSGLNLVGYPPGQGRRELVAQLQEVGLPVNNCLIPELGVGDLRRYLIGRTSLVYPHAAWLDLANCILGDLGVPLVRLAAPYGLRRTHEWFLAASRELERPDAFDTWLKRHYEPAKAIFEEATGQVAGFRLGLVVDAASLERLTDPTRLYGFELAALLEEMGFGLEVLVRTPGPVSDLSAGFLQKLVEPDRHRIVGFGSPAELADLLHAGEFQAVYSEVFFDRRISLAGKAQFHLGMLELGLDGAMRGLSRLLALCRWPFYRRYRDHLPKPKVVR